MTWPTVRLFPHTWGDSAGQDAMVGGVVRRDDETFAVVASTPRSGTMYIRAVLERVGISSGHETVFMSSGRVNKPPDWLTVEVSGFAGLHPFTNDGPVLHQLRHPLKAISSLATLGLIRTHDPVKVAEWYVAMVGNNEAAADFTYRVEDMDVPLLRKICELIGHDVDDETLESALAHVPRDTNTKPRTDFSYDDFGVHGDAVEELVNEWSY